MVNFRLILLAIQSNLIFLLCFQFYYVTGLPVYSLRVAQSSNYNSFPSQLSKLSFNRNSQKTQRLSPIAFILSPITQDVTASALSLVGSVAWLQLWITLANKDIINPKLSRKIIHWYASLNHPSYV